MDVGISARHCSPSDSAREHVEQRIRRLGRFEERLSSADVVLDAEHGTKRVEVRLFAAGRQVALAEGAGDRFEDATNRAAARLARQLKRRRGRRRDRRRSRQDDHAGRRVMPPPEA